MNTDMKNKQIPDMLVFAVLYAIVFGISIWLLAFHKESPTNWILYVLMSASVEMGLLKLALNSRKARQLSA
jgi:hypothetical protein